VLTGLDWDDKRIWTRSMELMAREVMPILRRSGGAAVAAR
jgi:hypothetical protein